MRWRSIWNIVALSGVAAASWGFAAGASKPAVALLHGHGAVEVNGLRVQPGTALFAGDHVTTGKDSTALLSPVSGGIVEVGQSTELDLESSGGAVFELRQGAVKVHSGKAGLTTIDLGGAAVSVETERGFPAVCRMAAVGRMAAVVSDGGHVSLRVRGTAIRLPVGKAMRLENGEPQAAGAGGQLAGHVSGEIPVGAIQHQGKGTEVPLSLNDAVDWNDVVHTLQSGRLRVALLDGSFLNVGARSVMRIISHNPQTQQTEIELTLGRMRGEVRKLTAPGAKFEVRTPTAVIGVVGTTFVVDSRQSQTRACSFEGLVSVRNINPAVAGQVTLQPGQCTTVPRGKPPSSPSTTAPVLSNLMNQTNVPSGLARSATAVISPGATSQATVVRAGTFAADAVAAAVAGVTVSRLDGARNLLQQANSNLTAAASADNKAANASNNALNAALAALNNSNGLGQAIQNFFGGLTISPSKPCPDC